MDKPRNILDELNESQRNAVLFTDGPELVIAGAGSGKTRMLTYKIAYLLYKGIPADRILALTFTNKAAREMRERISAMVGWNMSKRLWMGTFHSIFGRILRAEADRIGFTPQFTIYDTSDSKSIIKNIIKEMALDDKKYKVAAIQNRISTAKNNLITAEAYASDPSFAQDDYLHQMPKLSEIFLRYSDRCKASNAMDFDDMLLYMNILVRDNADILSKYQDFFQYILVDEYQDTNFAQYLIIKKLAEKHNRLCVVGDDAQSIYSFRGANIDNILKFKDQQPNCKLFKLERNYRSTQNIVDAANSLIIKNKGQIRKNVYSEGEVGDKIHVKSLYSDLEEGDYIAKEVQSTQKSGCEWKDIAVLYRTNAQSRVIEEAFRKKAIPYKIYGGLSFYQRKEVKDALCYMRLVLNESDEEALRRIINVPARGIGDTTVNKVFAKAHDSQTPAWSIINAPVEHQLDVNKGTAKKLMEFAQLIEPFRAEVESADAYTLAQSIIKASGLRGRDERKQPGRHNPKREHRRAAEGHKRILRAAHGRKRRGDEAERLHERSGAGDRPGREEQGGRQRREHDDRARSQRPGIRPHIHRRARGATVPFCHGRDHERNRRRAETALRGDNESQKDMPHKLRKAKVEKRQDKPDEPEPIPERHRQEVSRRGRDRKHTEPRLGMERRGRQPCSREAVERGKKLQSKPHAESGDSDTGHIQSEKSGQKTQDRKHTKRRRVHSGRNKSRHKS